VRSNKNALIVPWQSVLTVAEAVSVPYLTTVDKICVRAGLKLYEPRSPRRRVPWRLIYVSPEFERWVSCDMPSIVVDQTQALPAAQLEAEFRGFCDGNALAVSQDFHCLDPLTKWVWELKTPSLRFVGWFPVMNCMILHKGGDADVLHEKYDNYRPLVEATDEFRLLLGGLPGPLTGVRAGDVVSNRVR
jgi:hypothetical protein